MDHRDVIRLWPTHQALADLLGCTRANVQSMDRKNRIPAKYWVRMMQADDRIAGEDLIWHARIDRER